MDIDLYLSTYRWISPNGGKVDLLSFILPAGGIWGAEQSQVGLFIYSRCCGHLRNVKNNQKNYSALGMLKKALGRNSHAEGDTERQTDNNSLKQPERRVFLHLSVHEGGVQTGRRRWGNDKNTGAYIKPKPVKSRAINADAGTPGDYPMLVFGYPV